VKTSLFPPPFSRIVNISHFGLTPTSGKSTLVAPEFSAPKV
jgi:hypothetical protein